MTLLTGSTGFLGSIILKFFDKNEVLTLARHNADIQVDLSKKIPIFNCKFNKVIHSAGLAHLTTKVNKNQELFDKINYVGTNNLLLGLKNSFIPDHFIFISSVAVYGISYGHNISENTPLLATDSYGLSKIKTEYLIKKWCIENNVICTILRPPLIIGLNPPGNFKDIIKAIKKRHYFNIQNNFSKRSMVLAEDIALLLKNIPMVNGDFNLSDGYHPSIFDFTNKISKQFHVKRPVVLPLFFFRILAFIGDNIYRNFPFNSKKLDKLTNTLTFDDSKARSCLYWQPKDVLNNFNLIIDNKDNINK